MLKKLFSIFIIIQLMSVAFSQVIDVIELAQIQKKAKKTPRRFTKYPVRLADYLCKDYQLLDITWGAGYVKEKRPIHKELIRIITGIPYLPKLKFKRRYNRQWFFSDPNKFILDHMPLIPQFQLLKKPYSIRQFETFDFSEDPDNLANTSGISVQLEAFSEQDELEKHRFQSDESYVYNQVNFRDRAFHRSAVIDSVFVNSYDPIEKELNIPLGTLIKMKCFC